MATLREYFETDFKNELILPSPINATLPIVYEFSARLHLDFTSNAIFISCFLPDCEYTLTIMETILDQLNIILDMNGKFEVHSGFAGERLICNSELKFTGRVYFYVETDISSSALDNFHIKAHLMNLSVCIRSQSYAIERSKLEKPLAFICHDSRDKTQVAQPIALGLSKLMCPVWYDEYSLKVGDRLRETIEKGLKECKKCILILSPNFLSNNGWTKVEFNSIFTREIIENDNFILPVWFGVNKEQVFEDSPSLADRFALDWELGESAVVAQLHQSIK